MLAFTCFHFYRRTKRGEPTGVKVKLVTLRPDGGHLNPCIKKILDHWATAPLTATGTREIGRVVGGSGRGSQNIALLRVHNAIPRAPGQRVFSLDALTWTGQFERGRELSASRRINFYRLAPWLYGFTARSHGTEAVAEGKGFAVIIFGLTRKRVQIYWRKAYRML